MVLEKKQITRNFFIFTMFCIYLQKLPNPLV